MSARKRLIYALVISVMAHFFGLVSFYGKGGGRSGPLRYPGMLLIELVNLSATGAHASVAAETLPEKPEAPVKEDKQPPTKPRVRPSLSREERHGDYAVRDKSNEDNDRAPSDRDAGLVPSGPAPVEDGDPSTVVPALPTDPGALRPRPDGPVDETPSEPGPVVRPAQCAACLAPAYPPEALERGLEGTVVLEVQVLEDGNIGDVYVVRGPGFPLLEETAIAAVKNWTFYPATTADGQPVSSTKRVTIPFVLTYK